jgi:hypothetical protein
MFREKFIAKVPEAIIESAHFNIRNWERTFNIASWVRFRTPRPNHVALMLHYTDDEGAKAAQVDHCVTELETTLLLSAHITIAGKGKVTEMSVYLKVNDNSSPYVIDELYVQSCEKGAVAQPKIIGAA